MFSTAFVLGFGFAVGTVHWLLKDTVDLETSQIRSSGFDITLSLSWWVGWIAVAYAIRLLIWH